MEKVSKAILLAIKGDCSSTIELNKETEIMGRQTKAGVVDLGIDSELVSRIHGKFYFSDDDWYYQDLNSTNGTFVNDEHLFRTDKIRKLMDGTTIRIDTVTATGVHQDEGVLLYFFAGDFRRKYTVCDLEQAFRSTGSVTIGRDKTNTICLDTVTVSRRQVEISGKNGFYTICDLRSTNGTIVNGERIFREIRLFPGDIIIMGNIKMIFTGKLLIYNKPDSGSYLSIRGLYREVPDMDNKGKLKTILHKVNLDIPESELVAVLGTSGAGKTTFMNCVIGYEQATGGVVMLNGTEVNANNTEMRKRIGYVPQQDLLRDGLSMESTLDYIGQLRLPEDVSRYERMGKIDRILEELDLEPELKKSKIKKLSGGQKKRVSIASELISDPPLMFLDEPTSGLDPETETNLVMLLRKLAHEYGKTLIVVTHTIRNIMKFDRVLFFGPGGHLCFAGSPKKAMDTFKVDDFVDIYTKVHENVGIYYSKCSDEFALSHNQSIRGGARR